MFSAHEVRELANHFGAHGARFAMRGPVGGRAIEDEHLGHLRRWTSQVRPRSRRRRFIDDSLLASAQFRGQSALPECGRHLQAIRGLMAPRGR